MGRAGHRAGLLATTAALLAAGAATAEDAQGAFGRIDADGDGRVTAAELEGALRAVFERRDTDGDGRLTGAELAARMPRLGGDRADMLISRRDADGDGSLDFDEFAPGAILAEMDADGDGALGPDEWQPRMFGRMLGAGRRG